MPLLTLTVKVLPSFATTAFTVMVTLPPFFQTFLKVLSSIFFGAAMSASGFPTQITSFPSNFEEYALCVGRPSALTPSEVNRMTSCAASYFNI